MNTAPVYPASAGLDVEWEITGLQLGNSDLENSSQWVPPQTESYLAPLPIYPLPSDLPPGGSR